jgi:hypothetical protein
LYVINDLNDPNELNQRCVEQQDSVVTLFRANGSNEWRAGSSEFRCCDDDIIKLHKKHKDLVKVNIVSLIELVSLEVR